MRQQLPQGEFLLRAGIWFLSQAWVALALTPLTPSSDYTLHTACLLFAWTLTLGPSCMLRTGSLALSGLLILNPLHILNISHLPWLILHAHCTLAGCLLGY